MSTLRPAQKIASKEVSPKSKLLLADVGAGKTAAVLSALRIRRITIGRKRTLVISTLRICNSVWKEEVPKWAPEFSYASVAGKAPAERQRILEDESIDIVAINFANLIWLADTYGSRITTLFPQLVIDESSKLENPRSNSFRAMKPLLPLFIWRLPMTGTPRANRLQDLWGNAYLADLGASLGQYFEGFLQNWFFQSEQAGHCKWRPKHNAEKEIYARLAGTVHRMPFEWHKPFEIDLYVECHPKVRAIEKEIDFALKQEFEKVIIDNVTYTQSGQRINAKTIQLSSGFIYDDDHNVVKIHSSKMDAFTEIVQEAKGEPIMVVYQFDHERDAILNEFPQARYLDSNETLRDWNNKKIEILLVHPLGCGHGVNAQYSGCDLQVWFSPTEDAELYTQTVGRLNRPGNDKKIRVIRLIMRNTKDKACYLMVEARQRGERATLDMFE